MLQSCIISISFINSAQPSTKGNKLLFSRSATQYDYYLLYEFEVQHRQRLKWGYDVFSRVLRFHQNESTFTFKIIYPRGIGPTYELYSSSRRTVVVPLLKNYMHFFGYFSVLGNVASPSSNEHGSWWASNIRPLD